MRISFTSFTQRRRARSRWRWPFRRARWSRAQSSPAVPPAVAATQPRAAARHQRRHGLAAHRSRSPTARRSGTSRRSRAGPNQKQIVAWSAVAYTPTGAKEPALGTIKIEGPTKVSVDDRVVSMDLRITEYNFKTLSPDQVKTLVADVQARAAERARASISTACSPTWTTARCRSKNAEGIKADPPKVFWAPAPAVLDQPRRRRRSGARSRASTCATRVNTNWDLFEHTPTQDAVPALQRRRGCRRRRWRGRGRR